MRVIKSLLLPALIAALFAYKKSDVVMGYKPIYEDTTALYNITYQPQGRAIEKGGKIYIMGDTLYQVEEGLGIHVIDVSEKSQPENIGFISIRGCSEVAVKQSTIFTNNYDKLLALQLHTQGLKVLSRTPASFAVQGLQTLPPESGYFECPVKVPGKVITGWKKVELTDPKCFF
ncbi:hypothetical protein ABDK00_011325 [Niabella insulamsoli]|uniref:hypothetical protein n=1 Tax=Niabella insulamsoli TaxID=3144874 RepID=UPI0031FC4301